MPRGPRDHPRLSPEDQSQKVTDHSLPAQVADRVPKRAADEPGVFVTFTGPAMWDKEAGHSSWEGKAGCKPRMLSTPSSEALTPNRAGWPN